MAYENAVDENLAVYKDAPAPTDDPVQDTLIQQVKKMLSKSKKHQQKYSKHWPNNYKFFMGKQYPDERPSWRFSESINICWATVWTIVPIMTDQRPEVEFQPQEPTDFVWTQALTTIQKSNWQKYNWDAVTADVVTEGLIYDVAYGAVEWNPALEDGIGDIEYCRFDPYYCFPDPICNDINDYKSRFFIKAEPESTDVLRKMYPHIADKIKSDIMPLKVRERNNSFGHRIYTDVDKGNWDRGTSSGADTEEEEYTMRIRCWMKSDAVIQEKVDQSDDEGNVRQIFRLRKQYPKGRYVEIISNQLVVDGPNGVVMGFKDGKADMVEYKDGKFPVAKFVDHAIPGEFYGQGEITQLLGPQKTINFVNSLILENARATANSQWIVGTDANVETDKITSEPGLIIETSNPNAIRREPGTPIAGGLLQLLDMVIGFPDKVSGVQDVTRGAVQPGVTSGLMLEGYVEAAQTRIRLKTRNLDKYLREIGFLKLSRMMQFYTTPRISRITNEQNLPQYIEFYITRDDKGNKVANVRRFGQDQNGQPVEEQQQTKMKALADVKITTGSALPFAKAQKVATAKELFNSKAIDRKELLKAVDWPNWEELAARLDEQDMAAAQQAAAAQGGA